MKSLTYKSFTFIRKNGISDIQHVRSHMMQVGIFSDNNIIEQIDGCILACEQINMRLRIHLNAKRIKSKNDNTWHNIVMGCLGNYRSKDHDIIEYSPMCKEKFIMMLDNIDTFLIPTEFNNINKYDIKDGIIKLWESFPRTIKYNANIESLDNIEEVWNLFNK